MIDVISRSEPFTAPIASTPWELVAQTKWGAYASEIERRAIIQAQTMAGNPTRALEVGCEGGRWSKMLWDLGWEMTCLDVDREMLDLCQRKIPRATCLLARPEDRTLPCPTAATRLLLCVEVAPVIQSDWFLPEANRILEPGGLLVGVFWNRLSWRAALNRLKSRLSGAGPSRFYTRSYPKWRKALPSHGFDLVYEEGFCWGPVGRSSDSALGPLWIHLERVCQLHRLTVFSPWVMFILRKSTAKSV